MTGYFQGAITSGTGPSQGSNTGVAVLEQSVTVTTVSAGTAVSGTITLPANSQILNFTVDRIVAQSVGGGTATAIAATVGTAAAGTEYMSSTAAVSAGRLAPTSTVAQLNAMSNIGNNTNVVLTIAPNGTILTTQGQFLLTVTYVPPLT